MAVRKLPPCDNCICTHLLVDIKNQTKCVIKHSQFIIATFAFKRETSQQHSVQHCVKK